MKFILAVLFFTLCLTSCWTIHFSRKNTAPFEYQFSQWHHIGVAGLVEFSEPVPVKGICSKSGGEWDAVSTRTGFIQYLVRGLTYGLYSPEEVRIKCSSAQMQKGSSKSGQLFIDTDEKQEKTQQL